MDIITTNKVKLIQWLRGDVSILQHVQARKLITKDEYFMLKNIQDSADKITNLLDLILGKGSGVCTAFLDLLKGDDVNESMPDLKKWIKTIDNSASSGRMDIITTNKVKLIQWLRGDSLILQHVQARKLITNDEYFMLKNIQDSADKITDLLDLILGKGSGVCTAFLNLLKEDEVNESMPDLKKWIKTIDNSASSGTNMSSSTPPAGRHGMEF